VGRAVTTPRVIDLGDHVAANITFLGLVDTTQTQAVRPSVPPPDRASWVQVSEAQETSAVEADIDSASDTSSVITVVAAPTIATPAATGQGLEKMQGKLHFTASVLSEQEISIQNVRHIGLISCTSASDTGILKAEGSAVVMTTVELSAPAKATPTAKEAAAISNAVNDGKYEIVKFVCESGAVGHIISDPSLCTTIMEMQGLIHITGVDSNILFSTNKLGRVLGTVNDRVICFDHAMISNRENIMFCHYGNSQSRVLP